MHITCGNELCRFFQTTRSGRTKLYGLRSRSPGGVRGPGVVCAIPPILSWLFEDVPNSVFSKPDVIFHPPERLFNNPTMRDMVNARQEVLSNYPLGVIVIGAIAVLVLLEAAMRVSGGGVLMSMDEPDDSELGGIAPTESMEDFRDDVDSLEKLEKYENNNRGLQLLAGVAAVAFWMAGFLNNSSLTP